MATYKSNLQKLRDRIAQIDLLFADVNDQILYLYGFVPGGLKCQKCFSTHLDIRKGNRKADCVVCGKLNFLTAQTFFHGVRRPIEWVRAIWLLEEGFLFSANMFAAVTGMAVASVSSMVSKLFLLMAEEMEDCQTECSSTFTKLFRRRSLQTPAVKHPSAEQDLFDEIENEKMAATLDLHLEQCLNDIYEPQAKIADVVEVRSFAAHSEPVCGSSVITEDDLVCAPMIALATANATAAGASSALAPAPLLDDRVDWLQEKNVFRLLSTSPIKFDSLIGKAKLSFADLSVALMHLEIGGLIKRLPGHLYVQKRLNWTDKSNHSAAEKQQMFEPFFEFVSGIFGGISRKYLQLYLAAHCCYISRVRWGIGRLFAACLSRGRITHRKKLAFVSPSVVSYVLPKKER